MTCCDSREKPKPFYLSAPRALKAEVRAVKRSPSIEDARASLAAIYAIKSLIEDTKIPEGQIEGLAGRIDVLQEKLEKVALDSKRLSAIAAEIGGAAMALRRLTETLSRRKKARNHRVP